MCAAAVATVLVVGTIGGVAWAGARDADVASAIRPAKKPPTTRSATTVPRVLAPGIPAPTPARAQVQVPWGSFTAPVALGYSRVWAGTEGGVAVVDPGSLQTLATVPTDLPALAIATSPDGVWILSGSNGYARVPDESDLPPYHLTRVDPVTLVARFETDLSDLGFHSSARSNRKVRLAASPGVAWVTFRSVLARVDASTDVVTTMPTSGYAIAHIAADAGGLWIATGGDAVIRLDLAGNEVRTIPLERGFMWSIASSGDAVWLVDVLPYTYAQNGVALGLVRIDAETFAVTSSVADVIAVVAGDGQVWVKAAHDAVVGQVDTRTGSIFRSVDVAIYGNTSSDGYTSPPFAIGDGSIWSASTSLQRTTP
jgi:hypothetical protein